MYTISTVYGACVYTADMAPKRLEVFSCIIIAMQYVLQSYVSGHTCARWSSWRPCSRWSTGTNWVSVKNKSLVTRVFCSGTLEVFQLLDLTIVWVFQIFTQHYKNWVRVKFSRSLPPSLPHTTPSTSGSPTLIKEYYMYSVCSWVFVLHWVPNFSGIISSIGIH